MPEKAEDDDNKEVKTNKDAEEPETVQKLFELEPCLQRSNSTNE